MISVAHGNFDDPLTIVDGKVVASGPLRLEEDEEIVEIYSWIVQDLDGDGVLARCDGESENGSGFSDSATRDVVGRKVGTWSAPPMAEDGEEPEPLRPGAALAMALAIGTRGGKVWSRYWWEQTVTLVDGGQSSA